MTNKLTTAQVESHLAAMTDWSCRGDLIERTFVFRDFVIAMHFANHIALEAERSQHHPDMLIKYNRVTLGYSTHDAGGLTEKDFAAAAFADATNSLLIR